MTDPLLEMGVEMVEASTPKNLLAKATLGGVEPSCERIAYCVGIRLGHCVSQNGDLPQTRSLLCVLLCAFLGWHDCCLLVVRERQMMADGEKFKLGQGLVLPISVA